MTSHVEKRGTLVFNAPETLTASQMTIDDMKKCDIWSLGMTLYMLCNPDLTIPYQLEIDQLKSRTQDAVKTEILNKLQSKTKPQFSARHSALQATEWLQIDDAYEKCTDFQPDSRPSADDLMSLLTEQSQSFSDYSLHVSQNTVLANHDGLIAAGGPSQEIPKNDGTNSCAFLSVVIADHILRQEIQLPNCESDAIWHDVVKMIDVIILNAPSHFNHLRSISLYYDPLEALTILKKASILKAQYEVSEEIVNQQYVFTKEGRRELLHVVSRLGQSDDCQVALYTCGGYTFIIGYYKNLLFLVDTHPIGHTLGGTGCGILKVCHAHDAYQLCSWVWRRLQHSGVKYTSYQSFSILLVSC